MLHDPGLSTAEVQTEPQGAIVLDWTMAWSDLGGLLGLDRGVRGTLEAEELVLAEPLLSNWMREGLWLSPSGASAVAPNNVLVMAGTEATDIVLRVEWESAPDATIHFELIEELPPGHRVAFRALCDPSSELVLLHGDSVTTPSFRTISVRRAEPTEPIEHVETASLDPGAIFICGAALLLLVLMILRRRSSPRLAR
jgi:hypothetical protein